MEISQYGEEAGVIEENGREYIERILSAVTESGFDLRAVPFRFYGGGSAEFLKRRDRTGRDLPPVFI